MTGEEYLARVTLELVCDHLSDGNVIIWHTQWHVNISQAFRNRCHFVNRYIFFTIGTYSLYIPIVCFIDYYLLDEYNYYYCTKLLNRRVYYIVIL